MKAWAELTESGQLRRLRPLAMAALQRYDIEPHRLRLIGGFTNAIFRVDTATERFALRVDYHQDHSDADVDNELTWLSAIAEDTDLGVCRLVRAADGSQYVYATATGVPTPRRCVLFHWVPGRPLADNPTEEGYFQLGQLSAGLHTHGRSFKPPHEPLTWDRIFYWPEEVDPVVIYEPRLSQYLDSKRRRILDSTIAALEPAFARLDPIERQTIHGDLHPWNVHRYRKRLVALDFEDVTWGHPVQDIAITLFYERDHAAYEDLRAAFGDGYRSVRQWPVSYEGELEHFMAARSVMFVNYVANLRSDPSDYYDVVFPRLQRFLDRWTP
jgi:Ser/Thr protein kinase RdoA (MazF antagonist)